MGRAYFVVRRCQILHYNNHLFLIDQRPDEIPAAQGIHNNNYYA